MKALVTGATGLVGSHLAEKLIERGDQVRTLVRKTSDTSHLAEKPIELVYGDLRDYESLKKAVSGVEVVYHCAALVMESGAWKDFYQINVLGTKNLLEACLSANIQRFVDVSTVGVYGVRSHERVTEESPFLPSPSYYTQTKIEAERLVDEYYREKGLPVVIIRPTLIYGPRDRNLSARVGRLLARSRMVLLNGGRGRAFFTYGGNVADAVILAGTRNNIIGRSYIISDDRVNTWKEFLDLMAEEMGVDKPGFSVPASLVYPLATVAEYGLKILLPWRPTPPLRTGVKLLSINRNFDISRAKNELGYVPRVSLQDGITSTVHWLRDCGIIGKSVE
ncbi:MAG: NAD-dependent epimerase/dehydratase family protein [Deltaproteobacteria bacterium]|nr:MAG: NAD-dependent epimerase/dehydratase family protein [Deltaproteobacteria bacterium]